LVRGRIPEFADLACLSNSLVSHFASTIGPCPSWRKGDGRTPRGTR